MGAGNPTWDKLFTVAPGAIGNILRSNLNYYHYDAMGNVVFIADFDGTPAQSFDQEAYGNVKSGSQSGYHLTTKEYDSSPELYYFWQRWYDPMLGRFISKAPFPVFQEHSYTYCNNNPTRLIDPRGEFSIVGILVCVVILGILYCLSSESSIALRGAAYNRACAAQAHVVLYNITLNNLNASADCIKWLNYASGNGGSTCDRCGYLQVAKGACEKDGIDVPIDPVWIK